ncbi:zinc finger, CCHC-type containing protein [Tanacetum coccineum]
MERGFFSQKGSGVGRGVKEKNVNRNKMNTSSGIGVSTDTMNEDITVGVASTVKEGVTPSVVDMLVEKDKICSLEDTIVPEFFTTLTMPVTTTAGNAPGKSSYDNITVKSSGKKVNVRTLFTPEGNGIGVVVPVDSIRAISARFSNTAYCFFLGKKVAYPVVANYVRNTWDAMFENGPWFIRNNPLILKKWHPDENLLKEDGRSSYARVMIELRTDVELKDNIVIAMPKITREGHYTCNVHVEYEWKPPRCSSCKVFGHIHEECPKNTGAGEKSVKKPSQTSRGVLSTASFSGNKKKDVEPTIEVSNSNPFDVLNSVDNDMEFWYYSYIEKIKKFKDLLTSRQAILVDKAGNPLKKVEFLSDNDSEDEVALVDNDMARSMAYEG